MRWIRSTLLCVALLCCANSLLQPKDRGQGDAADGKSSPSAASGPAGGRNDAQDRKSSKSVKKQAHDALKKIKELDHVDEQVMRGGLRFKATFLPRFHLEIRDFVKALCTMVFGLTWFALYFNSMYETDRHENLQRWEKAVAHLGGEVSDTPNLKPDLVILFHHPDFKYADSEVEVSSASIDRVMLSHSMLELENLKDLKNASRKRDYRVMLEEMSCKVKTVIRSQRMSDPESQESPAQFPTRGAVRKAILQDLYRILPNFGFDVRSFRSIDGDELFLCISLLHRDVIEYYLIKNSIKLHMRPEIVDRIGVKQDAEDPASSPPLLSYEPNMVKRLHKDGVLGKPDPTELYEPFHGTGKENAILSTVNSINIICRELTNHLDLDAAREEGIILDWFPVHNAMRVAELRATWSSWSKLFDFTFVQPVPLIREYFGARIGFLFAWNGVYCKALLALAVVAVMHELGGCLVRTEPQLVKLFMGQLVDVNVFKSRQVIGFSIVMIAWSRIASNLWDRERDFFLELWDLHGHTVELTKRPQFEGSPQPSPIDRTMQELVEPRWLAMSRRAVSEAAALFFCVLVAGLVCVWMFLFEGRMGVVSSIVLSAQIKVLEFLFYYVAVFLTKFENHKFKNKYHDSFLWKQFLFQCVNNYSPFFFLTIYNAWTRESCPMGGWPGGCLNVLRYQLIFVLLILCSCSIAQTLAYTLLVKFNLWIEVYQYRRRGEVAPERSQLEEQAKYTDLEELGELTAMVTLVISLGHVLLFGCVTAIIIPFCFIVFAVQLRAFAVLLTDSGKRMFPQIQIGIGAWHYAVSLIMKLGVFYSAFMFVGYGETFKRANMVARFTGFTIFIVASFVIWAMVDYVCPPSCNDARLLAVRRDHVKKKLIQTVESVSPPVHSSPRNLNHKDDVANGVWSSIPQLVPQK